MRKITLTLAPHHDDECIGCGGLLLKLRDSGWDNSIAVVFDSIEGADTPAGQNRLRESDAAMTVLGAKRIDLILSCRREHSDEELIWQFVPLIRQVKPSVLLIPHAEERDPEHRKVFRAAMEAIWLAGSPFRTEYGPPAPSIDCVLGYEVWTPSRDPALTIDIEEQMDLKMQALNCYQSQLAVTDLASAMDGISRYRGAMRGGAPHSESFTVERLSEQSLSFFDEPEVTKNWK